MSAAQIILEQVRFPLPEEEWKKPKLCRYCFLAFLPRTRGHRYCSKVCGKKMETASMKRRWGPEHVKWRAKKNRQLRKRRAKKAEERRRREEALALEDKVERQKALKAARMRRYRARKTEKARAWGVATEKLEKKEGG